MRRWVGATIGGAIQQWNCCSVKVSWLLPEVWARTSPWLGSPEGEYMSQLVCECGSCGKRRPPSKSSWRSSRAFWLVVIVSITAGLVQFLWPVESEAIGDLSKQHIADGSTSTKDHQPGGNPRAKLSHETPSPSGQSHSRASQLKPQPNKQLHGTVVYSAGPPVCICDGWVIDIGRGFMPMSKLQTDDGARLTEELQGQGHASGHGTSKPSWFPVVRIGSSLLSWPWLR